MIEPIKKIDTKWQVDKSAMRNIIKSTGSSKYLRKGEDRVVFDREAEGEGSWEIGVNVNDSNTIMYQRKTEDGFVFYTAGESSSSLEGRIFVAARMGVQKSKLEIKEVLDLFGFHRHDAICNNQSEFFKKEISNGSTSLLVGFYDDEYSRWSISLSTRYGNQYSIFRFEQRDSSYKANANDTLPGGRNLAHDLLAAFVVVEARLALSHPQSRHNPLRGDKYTLEQALSAGLKVVNERIENQCSMPDDLSTQDTSKKLLNHGV